MYITPFSVNKISTGMRLTSPNTERILSFTDLNFEKHGSAGKLLKGMIIYSL